MNYNEAKALKATVGDTIEKDLKDLGKKTFNVIIVPENNNDRADYLDYYRGPFKDEEAILFSKNGRYLVMGILVSEDKSMMLHTFILQ